MRMKIYRSRGVRKKSQTNQNRIYFAETKILDLKFIYGNFGYRNLSVIFFPDSIFILNIDFDVNRRSISDQICHRFIIVILQFMGFTWHFRFSVLCCLFSISNALLALEKCTAVHYCLVSFFVWIRKKKRSIRYSMNGWMLKRRHHRVVVFKHDITTPISVYNVVHWLHQHKTSVRRSISVNHSMRWKPIKDIFSKWNSIMAKSIKFTGDELLMDEISVKRAEQLSEISVLMRICVCVRVWMSGWACMNLIALKSYAMQFISDK